MNLEKDTEKLTKELAKEGFDHLKKLIEAKVPEHVAADIVNSLEKHFILCITEKMYKLNEIYEIGLIINNAVAIFDAEYLV